MRIPNLQTLKTAAQQAVVAAKNTEETTKKVTDVAAAIKDGQEAVKDAIENGPKLADVVNKKDEVVKVEVPAEAPKTEEVKLEVPKTEVEPKTEEVKLEVPKTEVEPKTEEVKLEVPKTEEVKLEVPKTEVEPKTEEVKLEVPKTFKELKSVYPNLKISDQARVAVKKQLREAELKFMRGLKERGGKQLKKGGTVATFEGIISSQKLKVDLEKGKRLDTLRGMVGKEGVDFRDDYSKMFRADHITFRGNEAKTRLARDNALNAWYFTPARREAANALKAVKDQSEQGFVSGVSKKFFS